MLYHLTFHLCLLSDTFKQSKKIYITSSVTKLRFQNLCCCLLFSGQVKGSQDHHVQINTQDSRHQGNLLVYGLQKTDLVSVLKHQVALSCPGWENMNPWRLKESDWRWSQSKEQGFIECITWNKDRNKGRYICKYWVSRKAEITETGRDMVWHTEWIWSDTQQ